MRINGQWLQSPNKNVQPTISVDVLAGDGSWRNAFFLVDTGADCTVFAADLLAALGLPSAPIGPLSGVGGSTPSVQVKTSIRLERDDGGTYTITSPFAGFTAQSALELSVLGRDVLDLFAVIVDRPGNAVCLLAPRHQYAVVVV
jgi:hypothetical protein